MPYTLSLLSGGNSLENALVFLCLESSALVLAIVLDHLVCWCAHNRWHLLLVVNELSGFSRIALLHVYNKVGNEEKKLGKNLNISTISYFGIKLIANKQTGVLNSFPHFIKV